MPITSQGLTDLYKRRKESPDPEETGGHFISALWNTISPETKRVFDKYMGGQYEGAGWQDVAADFLPDNPYAVAQPAAMGMTKVVGAPGGNRLIQSLDDATGRLRGELGYRDAPGRGAIIQSFRSQAPEATKEMYQAFNQEMGPLLDKVKVQGNIRPEAWQSVKGALDKGLYDETPNLAEQWRRALTESQTRYPNPGDVQAGRWNPYTR